MKNFVKNNSIKFADFFLSKRIWFNLCCRQTYQNIDGNSHIGRYSKGQISVDRYIGRSLHTVHLLAS